MSKGGSSPTSSTVTQTNLPEYVSPFFERELSRTESQSLQPYTTYGGQRLADFSNDQNAAFQGVRNLQQPSQLDWATQKTEAVGAQQPNYQPQTFNSGYQAGTPQPGYQPTNYSQNYQAGNFNGGGYSPSSFNNPYSNPQAYNNQEWNTGQLSQYMNPYTQAVLQNQQDLALGRFNEQQKSRDAAAVANGAFGGSRAALVNSQAQRDLNEQLGTMQGQALQNAYTTGANIFQSDQGRNLAGYQANQQAGQTAAQLGLSAQNLGEQSRQYGGNLALQGFQANQAAQQAQANDMFRAQQGSDQSRQFGAGLGLQAYTAGQQAQQTQGAQNLQAQQLSDASRQYLAGLGLQYGNLGLNAANQAANIGQAGQTMDLQRLSALGSVGGQQQDLNQRSLDVGYQDFLNQQNWDQNQLNFYNSMLHGVPVSPSSSQTQYGGTGSMAQNIAGLGLAGYGAYKAFGT